MKWGEGGGRGRSVLKPTSAPYPGLVQNYSMIVSSAGVGRIVKRDGKSNAEQIYCRMTWMWK